MSDITIYASAKSTHARAVAGIPFWEVDAEGWVTQSRTGKLNPSLASSFPTGRSLYYTKSGTSRDRGFLLTHNTRNGQVTEIPFRVIGTNSSGGTGRPFDVTTEDPSDADHLHVTGTVDLDRLTVRTGEP